MTSALRRVRCGAETLSGLLSQVNVHRLGPGAIVFFEVSFM